MQKQLKQNEVEELQTKIQVKLEVKQQQVTRAYNTSDGSLKIKSNSANSIQAILYVIASKGLLNNQDIQDLQQGFIEEFIKMDQKNLLDDKMRMVLSKLTDLHFLRYPQMQFQPSFLIKEQDPHKDNHENQLNLQKVNDKLLPKQSYNGDLKRKEIIFKQFSINNQRKMSKQFIRHKGYQLCSEFLNISMKRLNVEDIVKPFCKSIKVWTSGHSSVHSATSFLNKLIAIKNFFPHYFDKISKQFLRVLQEFNLSETKNEVQKYAKKTLTLRYQNCMKVYTENDDILTAAQQLYKKSRLSSFGTKILLFQDYQVQMKRKARKLQAQKQSQILASMNLYAKT